MSELNRFNTFMAGTCLGVYSLFIISYMNNETLKQELGLLTFFIISVLALLGVILNLWELNNQNQKGGKPNGNVI